MELPSLGQHCSLQQCNQLDFLPFTCSNCQQVFCKEHYITSAHDCKCLNEFFKKPVESKPIEFHSCSQKDCADRSPIPLLCSHCNLHFCVSHRHHGCTDDLERKKLKVEQWRKPKEQFRAAKEECDKKVEQTLRKAETTSQSALAQKIRLMKIKGKAIGDGKIPTQDRIYFSVLAPIADNVVAKPLPVYTCKQWSVGRTIDLFSKKLKVVNRNNELNEPKLRLFKLSDGLQISNATDTVMETLLDSVLYNGDSLIMSYVNEDVLKSEQIVKIESEELKKYKLAAVQ